jgi:hypothetical protein
VDGELAEIGGNPLAAQPFGDRCRSAGAGEEIGNKIVLVAAGLDDAFEKSFRLLSWVLNSLLSG